MGPRFFFNSLQVLDLKKQELLKGCNIGGFSRILVIFANSCFIVVAVCDLVHDVERLYKLNVNC